MASKPGATPSGFRAYRRLLPNFVVSEYAVTQQESGPTINRSEGGALKSFSSGLQVQISTVVSSRTYRIAAVTIRCQSRIFCV
jgi:hypothetical protein